jgi:hypothetical protein
MGVGVGVRAGEEKKTKQNTHGTEGKIGNNK